MLGFYANLVVALLDVHLGEVFRACHVVQQLVSARQWVLVFEGDSVECKVVRYRISCARTTLQLRKGCAQAQSGQIGDKSPAAS